MRSSRSGTASGSDRGRWQLAALLGLGLLTALSTLPARAQDGVVRKPAELAEEIEKLARKCMAREGGIWGGLFSSGSDRLVLGVFGYHPSKERVVRRAEAEYLITEVESELSRLSGLEVKTARNMGEGLGGVWDLFGAKKGEEVAKIADDGKIDVLLFAEGVSRNAGIIRTTMRVFRPSTGCESTTLYDRVEPPVGNKSPAEALILNAARRLFEEQPDAHRIAILPTVFGVSRVEPGLADLLEAKLADALKEAADLRRQTIGKALAPPEILLLRQGTFIPAGEENGVWSAQITFTNSEAGKEMAVLFDNPAAGSLLERETVLPEDIPGAPASADAIQVVPDKARFVAGQDVFGFSFRVLDDRRVYCLLRALDGEALLLLPARKPAKAKEKMLKRREEPYTLVGGDFGYDPIFKAAKPTNDVVHCFAMKDRPAPKLDKTWHDNTLFERADKGEPIFIAPETASRLLTDLRGVPGVEEHVSRILVVKP